MTRCVVFHTGRLVDGGSRVGGRTAKLEEADSQKQKYECSGHNAA